MHTAQDGEPAGSLSYETGALVRIDLTTYRSGTLRVSFRTAKQRLGEALMLPIVRQTLPAAPAKPRGLPRQLASDAPSHNTFESTSGQDIDSNGYGACRSISARCSPQLTIADMAKPVATASLTSSCKVDVREVARS